MQVLRRIAPLLAALGVFACTRDAGPPGAAETASATRPGAAETASATRPGAAETASAVRPADASDAASVASARSCLAQSVASTAAMRCWVEWLAAPALAGRAPGSQGGRAARAGLERVFQDLSLEPAGEDGGYAQPLPRGANLLARVPGRDPARATEFVVIGAHLDHLGERGEATYRGADDNASGVAVLVEVARRLAAAPTARSVLIAAFDAEEPPAYLSPAMGSTYWVAHPTVPRAQVVAMLAMDLMGGNLWPGARTPLYVMGRETVLAGAAPPATGPAVPVQAMHLRLVEDLPGGRQAFSDHGAFFAAQIPVLFFSTGRSPHYHRVTDVPDTLDYEKLAAEVAIVEAHLRWLADLPERPAWQARQPVRAADADAVAGLLAGASASGGSPEFSGLTTSIVRADLAHLRRLSAGAPDRPLTDAETRDVVAVSLRAQCILMPDDEAPTAACLML